jgi:hypothetical protein
MDQTQIDELLLYFLCAAPDKTVDGRFEPLSEADWDDLLQQSSRHGITPLFYHRLRTFHPDIPIPSDVIERLRQAYLENAARNLRLYNYLCQVLKILRRDGIPVIVLKGAHLAELVYGNRALRLVGDLDLLVKKDDLMRVDALLLEMGCTPFNHRRIVYKDNNQFAYLMPKRDVNLEIHWRILPPRDPFAIDTDRQWERSRPVLIAGVDAAVLCPEDLLLHLCLHAGCGHGFEPGLRLFCDISEVLQHDGSVMDWGIVQRRTRQWGIGKCVYLTLRLTRELVGVALPEGLMEALKPDDFDERYVALARDQIFSRRLRTGPLSLVSMSPAAVRCLVSARLRDKVCLILKSLFLPRETMSLIYPTPADSTRIYFYYIVRLRDLLRRYGRDAWRWLWLRRKEEIKTFSKEGKDLITLKDWLISS